MSRRLVLKHPIALVGMLGMGIYHPTFKSKKVPQNFKLDKFGEMMVEMLPQDLTFTIFIPSEEAFKRDLHLSVNESLVTEKFNDTYAILTRILGFSAVPRELSSIDVPLGELVSYDSLSGFQLYISKDINRMLFVNRIRSKITDVRKDIHFSELRKDPWILWNINLLLGATHPQNLSIVQNISLSHAGRTYKLIWAAIKDGIYNVRLGYRAVLQAKEEERIPIRAGVLPLQYLSTQSSSSVSLNSKLWRTVWKLIVLPKIKSLVLARSE
ncbi:hypothetical protein K1719_026716 [Acacia pycnantha]|nr:hypothetical protein K1719_026716 [Acacia pycnantha]